MKIRPIGHAGFIVEARGKRILIDPWFNPAFCGTWLPPMPWLADEVAAMKFDHVYISHGHEDHYDKKFLSRLGEIQIFLPDWMTMIRDDYRGDSMLLIDDGATRALFANDCNTDKCDWPKNVDILACQFSGASYYPTCYDYDEYTMPGKIAEARSTQRTMLLDKIAACGAKAYIPCCGPANVVGVKTGLGTAFPHWEEVEPYVKAAFTDLRILPEGPEVTITLTGKKNTTTITLPEWLHDKITSGEVTWEEALLTFKCRLHREPDVYDRELIDTLRGRHAPH